MTTKKTTRAYLVTAHKESECNGLTTELSFSNVAVFNNEKDAKLAVKRMIVYEYLSNPELTVYNFGDDFIEYSLKGFEFERFKYTWKIKTRVSF